MRDSQTRTNVLLPRSTQEAGKAQLVTINLIVGGDSERDFRLSTNDQNTAEKCRLEATVYRSLDEIHADTPIQCVLVAESNRQIETFAIRWANRNKVNTRSFRQNWRKYRKGAAAQAGQAMLRARVGPKMLLVFVGSEVSPTTRSLIGKAEQARIMVVVKQK